MAWKKICLIFVLLVGLPGSLSAAIGESCNAELGQTPGYSDARERLNSLFRDQAPLSQQLEEIGSLQLDELNCREQIDLRLWRASALNMHGKSDQAVSELNGLFRADLTPYLKRHVGHLLVRLYLQGEEVPNIEQTVDDLIGTAIPGFETAEPRQAKLLTYAEAYSKAGALTKSSELIERLRIVEVPRDRTQRHARSMERLRLLLQSLDRDDLNDTLITERYVLWADFCSGYQLSIAPPLECWAGGTEIGSLVP